MRNLFSIPWATVNPALESLAQNWVEGFFDSEIKNRVRDSEGDDLGKLLEDGFVVEVLEKFGAVGHAEEELLDVALGGEDVDGETDVEDAFAGKDVFADFGQDKLENSLLIVHFLLVHKNDSSIFFIMNPVPFPDCMTLNYWVINV